MAISTEKGVATFEALTLGWEGAVGCLSLLCKARGESRLQYIATLKDESLARLKSKQQDLGFANYLRTVGLAIHNYHDTFRKLPRDILSEDGRPLLSWRVALLPWVEEQALHDLFHLDEPWNSEHNLKLMEEVPQVYRSRGRQEPMKTSIHLVTGSGTAGEADTFDDIKNTETALALIESDELVQWSRPGGFEFDAQSPADGLRAGGSFGVLYDGALIFLSPKADHDLLRSAFLDDGKEIDLEQLSYGDSPYGRFPRIPRPVQLSDERFGEVLSRLTSDNEVEVLDALKLLAGAQTLGTRSQPVLDSVTPLLKSESPLVRLYALKAISEWRAGGKADWRAIAELLEDSYEGNRWHAIELLAEFPEPDLVRAMLRLPLQDRPVAGRVLYEKYAAIAAEAAVPLLKDRDPHVRMGACYLIAGTGGEEHIQLLEAMLEDENEMCRVAGKAALARLQQPGPLATAVEEFSGNILAALEKVAKSVETDEEGNVIAVDLTEFDTPYHLVSSDFAVLAKLSHLQSLKLTYSSVTAKDIASLKDLPLQWLEINYCPRITDAVADSLLAMKTLNVLAIEETQVGDETAIAIGHLKELLELDMSSTQVGDAGVAQLSKLPRLQSLNLSDTRVSDQGLASIDEHPRLQDLYLLGTDITDAGVEHLMTLKALTFINLSGSNVTADGYARLQKALPDCQVVGLDR